MSAAILDKLVKSVLYEGYMLYPYRRSALKNQHRWNFGIVYPEGTAPCTMTTECLVESTQSAPDVGVEVRFLQVDSPDGEPEERRILTSSTNPIPLAFEFGNVLGVVETSSTEIQKNVFRIRVHISNRTALDAGADPVTRSLISTHTILSVRDGKFISLLDPSAEYAEAAASCRNVGTWPVLIGKEPERHCMLSSPIILYDYPQVAPESPGDYFDGAEIDELLTLRVLTLTDQEKEEVRRSGERARQILERAESLTQEQLLKLHGTMRNVQGVLKRGDRVRLKPKPGGDVFDVVLAGRVAIVESVEQDLEDRIHVAVVIEDDPGKDLGFMRQPGHRFFFSPEEVELLT